MSFKLSFFSQNCKEKMARYKKLCFFLTILSKKIIIFPKYLIIQTFSSVLHLYLTIQICYFFVWIPSLNLTIPFFPPQNKTTTTKNVIQTFFFSQNCKKKWQDIIFFFFLPFSCNSEQKINLTSQGFFPQIYISQFIFLFCLNSLHLTILLFPSQDKTQKSIFFIELWEK